MKQKEVLCVGLSCMDVLIKNVDLMTPFTAESKPAEKVSISIGGDAANEAVVLARLGHSVGLVTGLGADEIGDYIRKYMSQNNVDMSASSSKEGAESTINVIVIQENGDRNFINSGIPESAMITPDISMFKGAKVVSLASLFMPPYSDADLAYQIAKGAKDQGCVTVADVIVAEDSNLETYKDALPYIDYMFPNREEAELLTGKKELDEMADVLLSYGIKNAIIKIGKKGCFVKNASGSFIVPGYHVKNVIDTTGAGDNFAAGFVSGILQNMSLRDACRYACGVAGVAIQYQGGCTGVKSREQVLNMLENME